jgi:hypothetical protein
MRFAEREGSVPDVFREDVLWTLKAYRLALFLADITWHDVVNLSKVAGLRKGVLDMEVPV